MSYENFDPNDLLIQSYPTKPSGFVHRIPHGIRAIHLPTGTVVTCDADRSQHKNRHDALTQLWEQVQGKPTYQDLLARVSALESAVITALRGTQLDEAGNRDDDGLIPFGSTKTAIRVLTDVIKQGGAE